MLGPVAAGLIGTTLPAFGYLPALAGDQFSLTAWSDLIAKPGLLRATWLSFFTGVSATLLSLTIVIAFCASWHGTALFRILLRLLSPLLAVPHVTLAFGLAFLIAPSGWLVRLLSPWLSGFTRPPDWLIIQDPNGLSLIAGLTIKEVPFLLLMTLAALGQSDAARNQPLARTLGYGPFSAWLFTVLPRVYPQLRLPVYAVLAFSISVVDISLVLAPNTPPPLAVLLLRWFNDPDLAQRFVASAGALLQFALVLMAIGLWIGLERVVTYAGLQWLRRGTRWRNDLGVRVCSAIGAILCFSLAFAGLGVLAIWSVASAWRFPDAFPSGISVVGWIRGGSTIGEPFVNTVTLATGSALIATFLVLGCLENEARQGRHAGHRALWLIYLPLLIPQLAFLFGAQILLNALRLDGSWLALLWSHLVFVLPYVFLSLADPYRRWDQRYARSAYCLGASSRKIWWQIKLPMLSRAILTAFAVGFAVSVAQYLPTLFAGAGRYPTLTTEAVNLAASGDRRLIGRYALLQLLLPMMVFWVAVAWPAWRFRHRRGMQVSP